MKGLLIGLAALGVVVAWLLGEYGTISPCGVLREEMVRDLAAEQLVAAMDEDQSGFELAGAALALQLAGPMVEAQIRAANLTGPQCIKALWRWKVEDRRSVVSPGTLAAVGGDREDADTLERVRDRLGGSPEITFMAVRTGRTSTGTRVLCGAARLEAASGGTLRRFIAVQSDYRDGLIEIENGDDEHFETAWETACGG